MESRYNGCKKGVLKKNGPTKYIFFKWETDAKTLSAEKDISRPYMPDLECAKQGTKKWLAAAGLHSPSYKEKQQ